MDKTAQRTAELARLELRARLLKKYPEMTAIAKALDVPYKSVIRYLSMRTSEPRDVPLWFLIQALQDLDGASVDEFLAPIYAQVAEEEASER